MSEAKRYSNLDVWKALHFGENTNGWVKYEDYARLMDEVERLTKAGDAMAEEFSFIGSPDGGFNSIERWNAAKEGKPHA